MGRLKHKRGRKSNYVKSLNNENHKAARERCLLRDGFTCRAETRGERCGQKIRLEMHHIDYKVLGKELESDNLKWCVMLCEDHHEFLHKQLSHPWHPYNRYKRPAD